MVIIAASAAYVINIIIVGPAHGCCGRWAYGGPWLVLMFSDGSGQHTL